MIDQRNLERFYLNFFAFPEGYFEQHTAEELKVTEEERQVLIKEHHHKPTREEKLIAAVEYCDEFATVFSDGDEEEYTSIMKDYLGDDYEEAMRLAGKEP